MGEMWFGNEAGHIHSSDASHVGLLTAGTKLSTIPAHAPGTTMREAREIARNGQIDPARPELLAEVMAEVRTRVRRYVQEPTDGAWHDLVDALARAYGDSETYDLLRAVEIHTLTSRGR